MGNKNKITITAKNYYIFWSIASAILFLGAMGFLLVSQDPQPTLVIDKSKVLATDTALQFDFSMPVAREIEIEITPQVYGSLHYKNTLWKDHLTRTAVFTPELTWKPGTTYEVVLKNVKSVFPTYRRPRTRTFVFSTPSAPGVSVVTPDTSAQLSPETIWQVVLDGDPTKLAEFNFQFDPEITFSASWEAATTTYQLRPDEPLSQGQEYHLVVSRQHVRWKWGSDTIGYQDEPVIIWENSWRVRPAPGISTVAPSGDQVALDEPLVIVFDENVDYDSFKENTTITPEVAGEWSTEDYQTIIFTPETWSEDTNYTVNLAAGLKTFDGGYLEKDAVYTFDTLGPLALLRSYPASGASGVGVGSTVEIVFDQPVERASAESAFSITPTVEGSFVWVDDQTMRYDPSGSFDFNMTYTITVAAGVASQIGPASTQAITIPFSTELSVTRLAVPFHWQEHNLSCEVAAAVMALAYYNVDVSEATLIDAVGFDPTAKTDGVWGNPHIAFVGNIDGHQPSTGYGVYWQPIARAVGVYREAEWFSGWTLPQLTAAIQDGHPVIIWGTAGSGSRIDWQTKEGGTVVAVNGEHTRVAIGYIGSADNPTKIITLDPLSGERTFDRASFLWNWGLLNNSGVLIK